MISKIINVQIHKEGSTCYIPITFDPKKTFGKTRAPVIVTLNNYTFRNTIAAMGDNTYCIPLRKSHREAVGLTGHETLNIQISLDEEKREVTIPTELQTILENNPTTQKQWQNLNYTHQREHAEAIKNAKKPTTRAKRLATIIASLTNNSEQKTKP